MKKIGIGVGEDAGVVFESLSQGTGETEVYCYTKPGSFDTDEFPFYMKISEKPHEELVKDLAAGSIDAAVRGTLPANQTLSFVRTVFGVSQLERIALLETGDRQKFLLAPVGVDEGWSVSEKVSLIKGGRRLAHVLGIPDTVAVLSGGRYGDLGRHRRVDRSLADAELTAHLSGAEHYEIRIEEAIRQHSGIIIAPDGITGNLIFRTLIFLGNGTGHGAPIVNISRVFVDTSRASPAYTNAIILAELLSKSH